MEDFADLGSAGANPATVEGTMLHFPARPFGDVACALLGRMLAGRGIFFQRKTDHRREADTGTNHA